MNTKQLREQVKQINLPPKAEKNSWLQRQIEIKQRILKDKPKEFLTWSVIHGCMFVGNAPYIYDEYNELFNSNDWHRWNGILKDPLFGQPDLWAGWTSGNLIHQAYHLKQFEDKTGKRIDELDSILEFGGGYGTMALLCRRLGFTGEYIIQDLPVISKLQEFYLFNVGINDIEFRIEYQLSDVDLIISLWALSETPDIFKNRFFRYHQTDNYLLSYASVWDTWNNDGYFDYFKAHNSDYEWYNWTIPHLSNSRYLIGSKDEG